MNLHRNVPKELLPTSSYNKKPGRWRTCTLPPVNSQSEWQQSEERTQELQNSRARAERTQSAHLDVRPPSAFSESIILKPTIRQDWVRNKRLDKAKV